MASGSTYGITTRTLEGSRFVLRDLASDSVCILSTYVVREMYSLDVKSDKHGTIKETAFIHA